jgi:hypothetical protein
MSEARVQQRLTAILAADMPGYSRMGADEEAALAAFAILCHPQKISMLLGNRYN